MQIILASASPRRKELLSRVCKEFEIIPAVGGEEADKTLPPSEYVRILAARKCGEVFLSHPQALVLGCDTVVALNGEILGKPEDKADAFRMLTKLSGRTHCVYTGVCVRVGSKTLERCAVTEVTFNRLSEKFIKDYIDGGSPMDKAGAYGIQDGGLVSSYKGSYTNVVGLPVELVEEMIAEALG